MRYQTDIHHRRSIRLRAYDYSQPNAYFVTICAQHRECLFGEILGGNIRLNQAGLMTIKWFKALPNKFTHMQCDEFICMPNHIHFIIHIVELDTQHPVGAHPRVRPIKKREQPDNGQTNTNTNIPTVVQWYKTMTTNEYIRGVKQNAWPTFNGKLWQRNYWERVIRNENELNQIREYIQTNPMTWEQDKLFIKESGRQQNLTEIQHISGADTHVRKVKKREHPSTCATHFKKINSVHTLGQTRGSAPTEKSFQKTQAIT